MQNIEFENYQNNYLMQIENDIKTFSEMSFLERRFLNGMVRYFRPEKILEIGVAAGASSAILLNAVSDITESKLISVDYCVKYYKNQTKNSGFLVGEYFPQFLNNWTLLTGGDVSKFIGEIGEKIDMVLLDTVHSHPWETLNFLTVLPYLKMGAWVVIHDISMYLDGNEAFACKYLFDHVTSDTKIRPLSEPLPNLFPNIGAFQITEDTHKYIKDVFMSLSLPWRDGVEQVNSKDLDMIYGVIKEKYSVELSNLFNDSVSAQTIYRANHKNRKPLNMLKDSIRKRNPKIYYTFKAKVQK